MTIEARELHTRDGVTLEAEWSAAAAGIRAVAVLCHPHPQYGGTMRSLVTSALFEALPARGIACLRFNFRGVEGSGGAHAEGRDEPLDVVAAIDAAIDTAGVAADAGTPLVLVGWSFGADVALAVDDARVAAWVAIAPPLRFGASAEPRAVGADARSKLLVLAAHDEFRAPADVEAEVAEWKNTRVEIVSGASHFFVGRTDRVVELVAEFVGGVVGGG